MSNDLARTRRRSPALAHRNEVREEAREALADHRFHGLAELRRVHKLLQEQARLHAQAQARAAEERARQERERAEFANWVGAVTPLMDGRRAEVDRLKPPPLPLQRRLDDEAVLRSSLSDEFDPASLLETDDQLSFCRPGVGPDVLRRLRQGAWSVQAQVDLHGHTRDEAREALSEFLAEAAKQGWRCVRVVHGKGLGSPGRQPVLKGKVRSWLVQRQDVLAFASAMGPDGGAGAVIVLLDARPGRRR